MSGEGPQVHIRMEPVEEGGLFCVLVCMMSFVTMTLLKRISGIKFPWGLSSNHVIVDKYGNVTVCSSGRIVDRYHISLHSVITLQSAP